MSDRDAGDFGDWLDSFKAARFQEGSVEVPCGSCAACCRSGQLIPVEPDESEALEHIPAEDLTPMPGQPGAYQLVHDPSGHCSQLGAAGCSVYAHRPRACRRYDCRIFPAAGVRPDQPLIAEAAARWRFSYPSEKARQRHADVRTAAVVLGFPGGLTAPASPTQHALAAIDGADEL
jgi:Fe-S-cluster containining protein